jgi:very-short-patch-repair endonuclease
MNLFRIKNDIRWVEHKNYRYGKEIDIYIPKYKLAIEYDSYFWHKNKLDSDADKHRHLKENGVTLLRVIDRRISLYDTDITIKYSIKMLVINNV